MQQLYRASDALVDHREAIEAHLYAVTQQLFGLGPAVTLLDLTNTYLEGEAKGQPRAQRGHSKEKRSDCPLITLALVLDDNGLVQRSRVYAGNVSESSTLEAMLAGLQAPADAIVVLDRGVATEANLTWLKERKLRSKVDGRSCRPTRKADTLALSDRIRLYSCRIQRAFGSHLNSARTVVRLSLDSPY